MVQSPSGASEEPIWARLDPLVQEERMIVGSKSELPSAYQTDKSLIRSFFPFGPPPNAHARTLGGDLANRQPHTHGQPFPIDPNNARGPDDWVSLSQPIEYSQADYQIRALMGMLVEDGMTAGGGPPGRANLGDYVMSERMSQFIAYSDC
jgi:hypothetical protein